MLDGQQARLTQAALETLAVIAYRQPVSRSRVSAIRGVNVDGVVRTLVTRGLVEEAGIDAESGAILYRTSSYFLERMGLGRPQRAARHRADAAGDRGHGRRPAEMLASAMPERRRRPTTPVTPTS